MNITLMQLCLSRVDPSLISACFFTELPRVSAMHVLFGGYLGIWGGCFFGFFAFFATRATYGILVPQPGIEPGPGQ